MPLDFPDCIPASFERLTVTGAVVSFTYPLAPAASVVGANVRFEGAGYFTVTGETPTATVGTPFFDGDERNLSLTELRHFQATRSGVTNGAAIATYFRRNR